MPCAHARRFDFVAHARKTSQGLGTRLSSSCACDHITQRYRWPKYIALCRRLKKRSVTRERLSACWRWTNARGRTTPSGETTRKSPKNKWRRTGWNGGTRTTLWKIFSSPSTELDLSVSRNRRSYGTKTFMGRVVRTQYVTLWMGWYEYLIGGWGGTKTLWHETLIGRVVRRPYGRGGWDEELMVRMVRNLYGANCIETANSFAGQFVIRGGGDGYETGMNKVKSCVKRRTRPSRLGLCKKLKLLNLDNHFAIPVVWMLFAL